MFGRNVPIKPIYEQQSHLNIISVWRTIQGEGPLAGEPAIFIRLAGCNLRCHFCDTEFTEGAQRKEIASIVEEVKFLAGESIVLVVLTGGEPLAQPIVPLVDQLLGEFHVQIETAGTVWQKGLERHMGSVTLVCSPKTEHVHPMVTEHCENWKYIIRAGEVDHEGLPNASTQDRGKAARLYRPSPPTTGIRQIWLQPCDEHEDDPARPLLKQNIGECVDQALRHGHRISFQLHKVLGVE
jgi:7-carboxy-7-deazaguanine synthase